MPNEEKKVSNWEERFEEWWHRNDTNNGYGGVTMTISSKESTKSFIASVREEAYAEGFAKGVEKAKEIVNGMYYRSTEDVLKALNELTNKS